MLKRILSSQQRERQKVGGRPGMQRLIADGLRCTRGGLVSQLERRHANFWAWQVGGTQNGLVLPPPAVQPDDWEALEEEKENKNRLEIRWGRGAGAQGGQAACGHGGWVADAVAAHAPTAFVTAPTMPTSVVCAPLVCRLRELQELLGRMQQQQAASAASGLPPGTAPAFSATEAEDLQHQVGVQTLFGGLCFFAMARLCAGAGHGMPACRRGQTGLNDAQMAPVWRERRHRDVSSGVTVNVSVPRAAQVAEARQALDRLQAIIDGPPAEYPALVEGEHAQVGSWGRAAVL